MDCISATAGSPAARAGVKSGDQIVAIYTDSKAANPGTYARRLGAETAWEYPSYEILLDTPVVFVVSVRQPSGRYALLIEPVEIAPTGDREADVDAIGILLQGRHEVFVPT